jgi:hypothetical protein
MAATDGGALIQVIHGSLAFLHNIRAAKQATQSEACLRHCFCGA